MSWTHGSVRRLLRQLRHPQSLERDDVALSLKRLYKTSNAKDALSQLIGGALSAYDPILRKIVERCDVRGEGTKQVAHELGLSMRQFFRYRGKAIEAIAIALEDASLVFPESSEPRLLLVRLLIEYDPRKALPIYGDVRLGIANLDAIGFLEARAASGERLSLHEVDRLAPELRAQGKIIVAQSAESHGSVDEAERIVAEIDADGREPSALFQLATLGVYQAIRRGDDAAAIKWCRELKRSATGDSRRELIAELRSVEARLRYPSSFDRSSLVLGDVNPQILPHIDLARTAARLQAYREFSNGDYAASYESARSAALAGFSLYDTLDALALTGRAAYQLGIEWKAQRLDSGSSGDWHHSFLSSVKARFMLRAEEARAEVRALAEQALRIATRARAPAAAAFARATLGAVAAREGNDLVAQREFVEAWKLFALHPDNLVACDLFAIEGAPEREIGVIAFDDIFTEAFSEVVRRRFPHLDAAREVESLRERLRGTASAQERMLAGGVPQALLLPLAGARFAA